MEDRRCQIYKCKMQLTFYQDYNLNAILTCPSLLPSELFDPELWLGQLGTAQ